MSSHHNISALPPPPNKKNKPKQKKKQNTLEEILKKIRRGEEKSNFMSGASIYKVPKRLYNLNKKAYTPRLVSIGPLHCKDQHLKTPMQDIKMNYVNSFLARMVKDSDERKLELLNKLINEMKIIEETKESSSLTDAKKCYAEEVDDELDEEMLVIDGCFILELLYKTHEKSDPHDPIFGSTLTFLTVQHDLLLLENQLPFSALGKLFLLTKNLMPTSSSMPSLDSLSEYVRFYFRNITDLGPGFDTTKIGPKKSCWKGEPESVIVQVEKKESKKESDYLHILDILLDGFHFFENDYKPVKKENPVLEALVNIHRPLQKFFSRLNGRDGDDDSGICPTGRDGHDDSEICPTDDNRICPTASELVEAGVKLLGCTSFEIKFSEADTPFGWCRRARFEIPILAIDDSTELFFRNLIAFEQCYPGIERRFTSYAGLMDNLISTVKDVEVLEKAGVISDCLGCRQEVVYLFNKLCKDVVDGGVFDETYRQATAYTKHFCQNL
ncbi:unnamed protein product [Camellia sinensis]